MNKLFCFGLFAALMVGCSGESAPEQAPTEQVQTAEIVQSADFGMTPKQINDGVQSLIGEALDKDFSYEIKPIEDFFTVDLTPNVNWTGSIESNGNVSEIKYSVLTRSADQADMLLFVFHAGALARTLSPDLPKEQTAGEMASMLSGMIKEIEQNKELVKAEKVISNVKYQSSLDPRTGIWVTTAKPAK